MPRCQWVYDDGGREAAGFRGSTGDCATRAIAIAEGRTYRAVYDELNGWLEQRYPRLYRSGKVGSARIGVRSRQLREYLSERGWTWVPTMRVGAGCRVHLRGDELPSGRIIARCSGHLVAVVDGVCHDIYDPTRGGRRCVYGYWTHPEVHR